MPHNRPRVGAVTAPSFALIVATLAVMAGLGILAMQSGAIEALNASGLFGR
jgi:hypothetical protein